MIWRNFYEINKIILFGSYAKDEADGIRDIDLFIVKNVNKSLEFYKNIIKEGIIIYERM